MFEMLIAIRTVFWQSYKSSSAKTKKKADTIKVCAGVLQTIPNFHKGSGRKIRFKVQFDCMAGLETL